VGLTWIAGACSALGPSDVMAGTSPAMTSEGVPKAGAGQVRSVAPLSAPSAVMGFHAHGATLRVGLRYAAPE
jgi:hypothetical protein